MTTYNTVFGGNTIASSAVSSIELSLTANIALTWPLETAPNSNLAAQIIDVMAVGQFTITMPPANMVSNGKALILNNLSAFTQTVLDNAGNTLAIVIPGAIYFFYVRNNATSQGLWGMFQYGAQVSALNVAAIAGAGLLPINGTLAQEIIVNDISATYSISLADRTTFLNWQGATGTIALPSAVMSGDGFYFQVRDSGTSTLQLIPFGVDKINGATSLTMQVNDSCFVVSDGIGWYTIGLGSIQSSFFNLLVVSLAGLSGTYTLPTSAYNQIGYKFTGALAGNIQVVVPPTAQEYWVNNQTTGFAFTIGTSGQSSPPALVTGQSGIFYSDGANIQNAIGNTLTNPVPVAQGGTGGQTQAAAQAGIAVFSAADAFLTSMILG